MCMCVSHPGDAAGDIVICLTLGCRAEQGGGTEGLGLQRESPLGVRDDGVTVGRVSVCAVLVCICVCLCEGVCVYSCMYG